MTYFSLAAIVLVLICISNGVGHIIDGLARLVHAAERIAKALEDDNAL